MQSSTPNWMRLVYKYQDAKDDSARIVARLPQFLTKGASALEIARHTQSKPEEVASVLKDLAVYDLVKAQTSGLNVSFGDTLYSMTAEGMQFFRQMQGARQS
ncbi:MAG: hypothetical protein ACKVXR_02135 [Planctomycetota bacterium]